MSDESPAKPDWEVPFLGRLCLIAWVCAVLFEAFDFLKPVRQLCLVFGPWACIITILHGMYLFSVRRRALIFALVLLVIPPTIHFGNVLLNIAKEKKLFESGDHKIATPSESTEESAEKKLTP